MFQIFLRDPNNKTYVMDITENDTPYDCLQYISAHIPQKGSIIDAYKKGWIKYKFIYQGRYMDNDRTLIGQNIGIQSTIYLSLYPIRLSKEV